MRKYIGIYTREEAEVMHEDNVYHYDCAYDEFRADSCKEEGCPFFGLCELSREEARRCSKFRIPYEKRVTRKDLAKAIRFLNQTGIVPEVPGKISRMDKKYNDMVYDLKVTIDNFDEEDKKGLDPHILHVYKLIELVEKLPSDRFLMLPHSFIDEEMKNLAGNKLCVLLAIYRHQIIKGIGKNFVSNHTIAMKAGVSPTNVDKPIKQLKELGYLENRLTRNEYGRRQNDWQVILSPSSKPPKRAKRAKREDITQ